MLLRDHIRQQPAILPVVAQDIRAQLRHVRAAACVPDRFILVGAGSSMNALVAGSEALARATGAVIELREPMSFADMPPSIAGKPLVIAMSQGGQSTATVAAAQRARAIGMPVLAITATAGSAITETGADTLMLPIGEETIGPKTKGYTASVMSLLALADHLAGRETVLDGLETQLAAFIGALEGVTHEFAEAVADTDFLTISGQLGQVGTALEAALKIVEISGVPCVGLDVEEALHGRYHAHTPHSLAVTITRNAGQLAMAQHAGMVLEGRGTRAMLCDVTGTVPSFGGFVLPWPTVNQSLGWDVLWAVIPFQLLAAIFARARGIEPERMIYPGLGAELGTKTATA
jgi:fructoselysine-6-P-deglycase FrlB-like protein